MSSNKFPSIKDQGNKSVLSSSGYHKILSLKLSTNILKPRVFNYSKIKIPRCVYFSKAKDVLSSFPPLPSKSTNFKYSRLIEPSSPKRVIEKNSPKPLNISPLIKDEKESNKKTVQSIVPNINIRSISTTRRNIFRLDSNTERKTILSKVQNNHNYEAFDSESYSSEEEYYLGNKLI
jgi:hypothetical protein